MKKKFHRNFDSLKDIFEFTAVFIEQNKITEEIAFSINLSIEELFTNMVKYHPDSSDDILISLAKDSEKLIITLTDFDVEPFDITQTKDIDQKQSLEERRIGGLGLYFVMKMMDNVTYEYKDGQSKITLIKKLRKQYV